jgi:hypothetical protein
MVALARVLDDGFRWSRLGRILDAGAAAVPAAAVERAPWIGFFAPAVPTAANNAAASAAAAVRL